MPFKPTMSAEDYRYLADLRSASKTYDQARKRFDKSTSDGQTMIDEYAERFIAVWDAANSAAPDSGEVRTQVEALRDLYESLQKSK